MFVQVVLFNGKYVSPERKINEYEIKKMFAHLFHQQHKFSFDGLWQNEGRCDKNVQLSLSGRDTDKVTEWNKTLLQSKLLHRINDDFSITYQVRGSRS